jgi:hypothetical protein
MVAYRGMWEEDLKPLSYIDRPRHLSNDAARAQAAARDGTGATLTDMHDDPDRPKSAEELAMERMRRKDADGGVGELPPTEAQKVAIAEARNVHASKVAELEILHRSKMSVLFDPAERASAEEAYRRDMARLHEDLERKISRIRVQRD